MKLACEIAAGIAVASAWVMIVMNLPVSDCINERNRGHARHSSQPSSGGVSETHAVGVKCAKS